MRVRIFNRVLGLAALALLVVTAEPASAEKRIALVVGNSAYKNITPLDNPSKDASLMAETLSSLGFTLVGGRAQLDLDKGAMDNAVQSFGPARSMFGSDWPVCTLAGSYDQVVLALEHNLAPLGLGAEDLQRIFGGTAREFYRL